MKTQRKVQYYVIPPKSNGGFVARMEQILYTYALPYDPKIPVVVMDEQPVQLFKEFIKVLLPDSIISQNLKQPALLFRMPFYNLLGNHSF